MSKKLKKVEEFNNFDWLNYLSAINDHKVFNYWKQNKDLFFERYFILNDIDYLIILDKKDFSEYKFKKITSTFNIEFEKDEEIELIKEKRLFSIGSIDIIKKVV